jgi:hypothetical protein
MTPVTKLFAFTSEANPTNTGGITAVSLHGFADA